MEYYEYTHESFLANPREKKAAMRFRMQEMGDVGWRVHTFIPISVEGYLHRYEVLFERVRQRE